MDRTRKLYIANSSPMSQRPAFRSRTVKLDAEPLRRYFSETGKQPDGTLRHCMARHRVDRTNFVPLMRRNRIPRWLWDALLPEGGVSFDDEPLSPDEMGVLEWFPNQNHVRGKTYSPLTWAGAGPNDAIDHVWMQDAEGDKVPVLPFDESRLSPVLRIHFRHRVSGVNPESSWWSAIVGCTFGAHPPEWQPVDLTKYRSVKIYARAYLDPMRRNEPLPEPLRLAFRFEDDHIVPGRPLHRSSSWCRERIEIPQWLRPASISLDTGFDWGANAFWNDCAAVDRKNILQITFGMDGSMPDQEGYFEIHRIELHP